MSTQVKRAARKGRASLTKRLLCASSMLAFTGGLSLAGSAMAQCTGPAVSIAGPASGAYTGPNYNIDKGGSYTTCPVSTTITSGTAVLMPYYGYLGTVQNNGWVPILSYSGALTTTSGAPQGGDLVGPINVNSGATLVIGGEQSIYSGPYEPMNNLLNAAGNVVFEGNGGFTGGNQYGLTGTTTLTGNVTLDAGANVRVGEYYGTPGGTFGSYTASGYYAAGAVNFGPNTNVALQGATGTFSDGSAKDALLYLNLNAPAVIGGSLSATAQSEVWLHAGALTVNGANTVANPFVGTLQLDPGTTFIVGDSTHASAVFGDPGATNGSTETLNIVRTSGTPANLMGYGAIYATVNNAGVVTPGGTAGTPGALTVSQYNQSSVGILSVEVSPTGASELKVLGTATLAGTLDLKIDPGKYGNAVIPIISAGSISGSFSNINTSGSAAAGLAITPTSYDVVTELTSATQVFGHLIDSDVTNINQFNDALYDNLQNAYPSSAPKTDMGGGFDVWLEPFGRAATVSHDGAGYDTSSEGLSGGVERKSVGDADGVPGLSNISLGAAGSYASETLNTDSSATKSTSDSYDAAIYGGFNTQNARIDVIAFYNSYNASVARHLGTSGTIDSSPTGTAYGVSLQIGHGVFDDMIVPYLRGTFAEIDQAAVTESGTNLLALKVNAIDKGYFFGEAGFKIHPDLSSVMAGIRPEITLAVQHDFTYNPGDQVVGQFANLSGSPFTFSWKGDQATAGLVGLNLASDVASHVQVFGKIDGRFTAYGQSGELRVGASYQF